MLAFISELADKKAMANEVSLGVDVGAGPPFHGITIRLWRRVIPLPPHPQQNPFSPAAEAGFLFGCER